MRDLLATRNGRLLTFFLLYVTEGIPLGFTATAIATQMRRRGVGPAEIGTFVAMLYLPWAWKWLAGPVVDTLYSDRIGRRRGWIVACQSAMALTLLAAAPVDFVTRLNWFVWIIFLHNAFAATMDVAIDALAVSVLPEGERGLANGLMFAGAYVGNALGGAGVLFLTPYVPFQSTFFLVAAALLSVTLLVSRRIREPPTQFESSGDVGASALVRTMASFESNVRAAAGALFGSRAAMAGLAFALMPAGAYALSLSLQSNLAVELGLNDRTIATMGLASAVLSAGGCVLGGAASDRFGRRRTIAFCLIATALPTLAMAAAMHAHGWIMPVDPKAVGRPAAAPGLIIAFWAATLVYALVHGLMYGVRTALFMDVCTPAVAATQFTAYMAMLNLVISYSAWWQGRSAERLGYPKTLMIDALLGLACLFVLPFMNRPRKKVFEARGFPLDASPEERANTAMSWRPIDEGA